MEAVDARLSLHKLDAEQAALCKRIATLTPAERESPSNLANWSVNDLAVHITRVCDSILRAVERALEGDRTPAFGAAAKPREDEIRAMTPEDWAELQRSENARIATTIASERCAPAGVRSLGNVGPTWISNDVLPAHIWHRLRIQEAFGMLWGVGRCVGGRRVALADRDQQGGYRTSGRVAPRRGRRLRGCSGFVCWRQRTRQISELCRDQRRE